MAQYKAAGLSNGSAFMQAFGNTVTEVDTVTVSAALAQNDTVDLIRIARGTKLISLETFNTDVDTGTAALAYKIGYRKVDSTGSLTDDDDYFGSSLTAWQAAVAASAPTRYAFAPITFDEDVYITATCTTAANALSTAATITTIAQGIARGGK